MELRISTREGDVESGPLIRSACFGTKRLSRKTEFNPLRSLSTRGAVRQSKRNEFRSMTSDFDGPLDAFKEYVECGAPFNRLLCPKRPSRRFRS
jgi:hypothetical protein